MPRVTILQSDLSGDEIPEGSGARIRVMWYDPNKNDMRADLTDAEVKKLLPFACEVEPRLSRRGPQRR